MLTTLLVLVIGTGLVIALIQLTTRWVMSRATRRFECRLRAVEEIVNEERVPEMWIRSSCQRIHEIRRSDGTDDEIERVGRRAHTHCLHQLDSLMCFLQDGNFFDSPETRAMVLEALHERRDTWVAGGWQALIQSAEVSSQEAGGTTTAGGPK